MRLETLIIHPIKELVLRVVDFIPTFIIALVILTVGYLVSKLITKLLVKLLRTIEFDKIFDTIGVTKILKKGGIKDKPSTLVGCLAYWTMMVMVLITTVKAFGLVAATAMLDSVLGYIPSIFMGVFILIIGMLLAKFVSIIVYVTAKSTDMPIPDTLARVSKWVIMFYVAIMFLKEVGFASLFVGIHYTIFIAGVVFALALAFGLAGKDVASKYLHVFDTHHEHA